MSSAAVSEATTQPRSSRPSTSGRMPWASRAAYRVFSSIQTNEKAPRRLGEHLDGVLLEAHVRVVREQRGDQAGVVGGGRRRLRGDVQLAERAGQAGDPLLQLAGVGQVAVVGQRDRAGLGGPEGGLGVVPGAGAGGGVARVADGEVALERLQRRLVEDLRDQAHVLVDQDLPAVADRDAGRLLAAVLQGVEAVVGQLGDVLTGRPDPEHAAGVLRTEVLGVECGGELAVAPGPPTGGVGGTAVGRLLSGHGPSLRAGRVADRIHADPA